MKISITIFVASMGIGLCFPGLPKSSSCPSTAAAHVEEAIQHVESWPQFAAFYSKHRKCDVDALRYGFTQQVAHLAANDQGLLGLSKMLTKHPHLRPNILWHLKSEAVSADDREQIRKVLQFCQSNQKRVCRDVATALGLE